MKICVGTLRIGSLLLFISSSVITATDVFITIDTAAAVVDACSAKPCGVGAQCRNAGSGQYLCSCPLGYSGDATKACVDIDECATTNATLCGLNADCVNLPGHYQCQCRRGYYGDPQKKCYDIDECALDSIPSNCGVNTYCKNTKGSSLCRCLPGFTGDPTKGCVDINECRDFDMNPCGMNAYCRNTQGSFKCQCRKGFVGDPYQQCRRADKCWADGIICAYGETCNQCCNTATYWWDRTNYACGTSQACWLDGTDCLPGVNCGQCCNGAYQDYGTKCGGKCWKDGRQCGLGTTCDLCCSDEYHWINNSTTLCGKDDCWKDGTTCRRFGSCEQCCNFAFAREGTQCGGKCWPDGRICNDESTCGLCCELSYFWPKLNHTACGTPPCLKDGTECKDEGCWNCCNGAYNGNGTVCGGECWDDGTLCAITGTCDLCCNSYSFSGRKNHYVCGYDNCLKKGYKCGKHKACDYCCEPSYEKIPKTCGAGKCWTNGTRCDINDDNYQDSTCYKCCNQDFWYNVDHYECGIEPCVPDGIDCIPGQNCSLCCNGAYANGGTQCGGTCLQNGTQCEFGKDCQLCCANYFGYSEYNYWFSLDSLACGYEPCFENGTECTPGDHRDIGYGSCDKCCYGAFNLTKNGDVICGGDCIADGDQCDLFTTCAKCCSKDSHYEEKQKSMVCGSIFDTCLTDGTSCIPGYSCDRCCNGTAYENDGTACGGSCWEKGKECEYYSTCRLCCSWSEWDPKKMSYACTDFC